MGKPIINHNHPSNHHIICGINNSHMGCLLFVVLTSFKPLRFDRVVLVVVLGGGDVGGGTV